ncbi:MAG: FkbM family methyltransferase [Nitrososphaerota archaeon]|nr:FkbM family methyltransferase [Nitrososphaerota archaeon]
MANKNVIDVGMSNGDSVLYFAKNGAKLVIGIEPDKKSFDLAVENIKASNLNERIIPLNKALSTEKGKTRLFVYENSPNGNSIDMGNMVKLNDSKYEEIVETISLSDVIEMLKGEEIGLLKMDCEGCEYKVLNNFDQNLYNKIENIYLEYHNGLQNLQSLLQTMGFSVEVFGNKEHLGYIKARKIK